MSVKHAKHNEDTCSYLIKNGNFNDWVVTTAFYSALHFVQYEMFPLTEKRVKYNSFNDYYNAVIKKNNPRINKHKATVYMVYKRIPKAGGSYRWLFDACMNARYINYQVSRSKAEKAKMSLDLIKSSLKKKI